MLQRWYMDRHATPQPITPPARVLDGHVKRQQLARELNVNERTLDRWHVAGVGPPRTVLFGRIYYSRASVAAWLARQEEQRAS